MKGRYIMSRAVLQLETLTCPTCIKKIENALSKQEGVEKVNVLFNASKAKVTFDEEVTTKDTLAEVVDNLGYEVESIR